MCQYFIASRKNVWRRTVKKIGHDEIKTTPSCVGVVFIWRYDSINH
jgi:hypothetical protein